MKISVLNDVCCHLGEGPVWDAAAEALYWVDSYGPTLYRNDFASGRTRSWPLPGKAVGSLAPRQQGGLILAMDQGLYAFDADSGALDSIAQPLAGREELRLNDGKVDPFGSFVTGAMNIDYTQDQNCSMYRLSPELELSEILDGFIDAEGYIWSAQWDDACIIRIAPDGVIDKRLDFPGQVVSSVMFGGPQLDLIYVTTTSGEVHGVTPVADSAGGVLVVSGTGYRGRPEPLFKG